MADEDYRLYRGEEWENYSFGIPGQETVDAANLRDNNFRESIFGTATNWESVRQGFRADLRAYTEGSGSKPTDIGLDQKAAASKMALALKYDGPRTAALMNSLENRDDFNQNHAFQMLRGLRDSNQLGLVPELRQLVDDVNEVADFKEGQAKEARFEPRLNNGDVVATEGGEKGPPTMNKHFKGAAAPLADPGATRHQFGREAAALVIRGEGPGITFGPNDPTPYQPAAKTPDTGFAPGGNGQ